MTSLILLAIASLNSALISSNNNDMDTRGPNPQLSYEQIAREANSHLPSQNDTKGAAKHALRLIWHLCQLCNVSTSTMSSWLALEALARETATQGAVDLSIYAYEPSIRATALMLHDIACNLTVMTGLLMQTALHQDCLRIPSYQSLIDTANRTPQILSLIPGQMMLDVDFMPSQEVVEQI